MAGTDLALSPRNRAFLRRQQARERPGVEHRPLVASARPIDLTNKTEARRLRVLRQGWQQDAAAYVDNLPELSFAYRFLSNASSRMRYFPALVNPDEPDGPPIPIHEVPGVPQGVIDCTQQAMTALGVGRQAISPIQKSLSYQFGVTGECYLTGMNDPLDGEETWKIRSVDEFQIYDDTYKLREVPLDPQGTLGWIDLDPATTYAARMWVPHWRFSMMATSPMRSLLDIAEELLLLSRDVRSTARSRLAGGGIMKVPEGLRMETVLEDNRDPEGESWFGRFAEALMTPLSDDGVASAVVPIIISGEPESLAALDHLVIDRPYSAMAIELRAEAIGRLATGLDVPREVLEGMSDPNHWGAWLVSDDTFRHHIEPQVIAQVDAMTVAYLRTWLTAAGIEKYWVDRACIWYNPVDLISKPDPMANAVLLHDRYAISNEALRTAGGFTRDDEPGSLEVEFRMLQRTRVFPPNMVEAIFHQVDPSLEFPPIKKTGEIPGIGPEGEEPVPDDPTPPAPGPTSPSDPTPPGGTPLGGETAPEPAASGTGLAVGAPAALATPGDAVFKAQITDAFVKHSRKLTQIDADLRSRIQVAACAAMTRVLERSGAKLRTRLGDRKFRGADTRRGIDTAAALASIDGLPNRLVASMLGESLVASLGFASAQALTGADWSELRSQFTGWTRTAQHQVLKVVQAMGSFPDDHAMFTATADQLAKAIAPAWAAFEQELNEIAERLLFTEDGDPVDAVTFDPNTIVPVGAVRRALAIAGGRPPVDQEDDPIVVAAGDVVDVAKATAVGESPGEAYAAVTLGQIGNGEAVTSLLTESGAAQIATYEWVHGPTSRPFEPHEALDGVTFSSFDDRVLANSSGFPENGYYFPGDHNGCSCDFSTLWEPGSGVTTATAPDEGMAAETEDFTNQLAAVGQQDYSTDMGDHLDEFGAGFRDRTEASEADADTYLRSSMDLNAYLRGETTVDDLAAEQDLDPDVVGDVVREMKATLDGMMEPTPSAVVVERTMPDTASVFGEADPQALVESLPGSVYSDPAYVSTSVIPHGAEFDGGVRMVVNVPQGTPAAPLFKYAVGTPVEDENELVLARGTRFAITAARYDELRAQLVVEATVLPPGG
ncbi:MAG: hypothetical protein KGH75_00050 [Rhodospirillales bacterium]|nr:hypothetical protein [Rhodospirillales bacterium]